MKTFLFLFCFILAVISFAAAEDCPLHAKHSADVDRRGDAVMGFDHHKSQHHFRIQEDGGAIEAEANDPNDSGTISQIQSHFAEIARSFSEGDFAKPREIHAQLPPGTDVMAELRKDIDYRVEKTEHGGRVRIRTSNPEALKAIHEFLRFQIQEHQTGDQE